MKLLLTLSLIILLYSGVANSIFIDKLFEMNEQLNIVVEAPKKEERSDRDIELMERVCQRGKLHGKTTELCNNRQLFDNGKKIFTDKGVVREIALGIMLAESHLGVNYAGSCDSTRNNRGGIKRRKNDDGSNTKDQQIPNNGNCWLYRFESIEDYFNSKANTLGIGYKGCFVYNTNYKITECISIYYVGQRGVINHGRVNNVMKIAY